MVLTSIIAQRAPRDLRALLVPFTESRNVDIVSFFREALAASIAEILVSVSGSWLDQWQREKLDRAGLLLKLAHDVCTSSSHRTFILA